MSVFELDDTYENKIPVHIKDFVIERIKKGETPNKIVENVKKVFNKKITSMAVARIRKHYIQLTGEHLKSYREFRGYPPRVKRK